MAALILTGPPGVGKTTVAGILAGREERAVHVEADRFFSFIRSGLIEPWDPASDAQNKLAMRTAAEAAASYARDGYATILDGIVIPRWTLGVAREAFEAAGLAVDYAVLRAPQPTCLARVRGREAHPDELRPSVLGGIATEFDDLGELERCAVAVEGMSPEHAADAVERARRDGVLRLGR